MRRRQQQRMLSNGISVPTGLPMFAGQDQPFGLAQSLRRQLLLRSALREWVALLRYRELKFRVQLQYGLS
jgi:hypothetical protein